MTTTSAVHGLVGLIPHSYRSQWYWHRQRFGTAATLWAGLARAVRGGEAVSVPTPDGARLWLRPGTADEKVFDEIFVHREYAVAVDDVKYVVDAGAHIGCATRFFRAAWPAAKIIAIEPDARNFALLARNVAPLTNVVPVHGALWSHSTQVAIKNPHKATYSYRVAESTGATAVPAYSVLDIIDSCNLPHIDVLKIDVEGSEVEVLQDAERWIDRVRVLIVETHDRWREGCTAAMNAAVAGANFTRRSVSGGLVTVFERPERTAVSKT